MTTITYTYTLNDIKHILTTKFSLHISLESIQSIQKLKYPNTNVNTNPDVNNNLNNITKLSVFEEDVYIYNYDPKLVTSTTTTTLTNTSHHNISTYNNHNNNHIGYNHNKKNNTKGNYNKLDNSKYSNKSNTNINKLNNQYASTLSNKYKENKDTPINKNIEINKDNENEVKSTVISSYVPISFRPRIVEPLVGISNDIQQIKIMLNKITSKNYLTIQPKFVDKMNEIFKQTLNDNDLTMLSEQIYNICSSNLLNSTIFADLYANLLHDYPRMLEYFNKKIKDIPDQYNHIEYISPEEDYDKYCEFNKLNEKRRAQLVFLCNLHNNSVITSEYLITLLDHLIICSNQYIDNTNYQFLEELILNIHVLYTSFTKLKSVISKQLTIKVNKLYNKIVELSNNNLLSSNLKFKLECVK